MAKIMELKRTAAGLFFAGLFSVSCMAQTQSDPSIHRPVSRAEIEQLKRQIAEETRSNVQLVFDYHNESGDLNNRLDFLRYGARLNLKLRSKQLLYFSVVQTSYATRDSVIDEEGTNFTLGFKMPLSERVDARFEAGATRFTTDTATINALAEIDFRTSEKTTLYVKGTRNNVEESLLSATGLRPVTGPFAGQLVGRVVDTQGLAGVSHRLIPKFDMFVEGGAGARTGKNVESNPFGQAKAGAGYNIIAAAPEKGVRLLRAGYQFQYFGFEKNLLGFGGASLLTADGERIPPSALGSDGISPTPTETQPGVGGYFSPDYYVSNVGRIDIHGRTRHLQYLLAGFAGVQKYTGSRTRQVHGFSGTAEWTMTDHLTLPLTYVRDNFGPFTQQSFSAALVVKF